MGVKFNKKGITLVEILIAMAIMSILAVSSVAIVPSYINKAYDARRKDDLHDMRIHLETYFGFAEEYPASLPDCGQPLKYKEKTILYATPCDPTTGKSYFYENKKGDLQFYRLYALLSDDDDVSVARAGCLGGCGPECYYNYGVSSVNTSLVKCSYVCAPGGGQLGLCELYENPEISLCPVLYYDDGVCNNECKVPANRCKNASGKNIPN